VLEQKIEEALAAEGLPKGLAAYVRAPRLADGQLQLRKCQASLGEQSWPVAASDSASGMIPAGRLLDQGSRRDLQDAVSAGVARTAGGKLKPLQELAARGHRYPSRYRVFKVRPRVLIDNAASRDHTVIEVNGRDRPGLLYEVTLALSKLKLTIRQARITTFGEHVVDVFYVQDQEGRKIESERRHGTIERKLLIALGDESGGSGSA